VQVQHRPPCPSPPLTERQRPATVGLESAGVSQHRASSHPTGRSMSAARPSSQIYECFSNLRGLNRSQPAALKCSGITQIGKDDRIAADHRRQNAE
jgi:hypothetical protein